MKINESVKYQVKAMVEEFILEALENGDVGEEIETMRNSVKAGYNEALDSTGASENGFRSWKFQR